jgi:hypothetical protein
MWFLHVLLLVALALALTVWGVTLVAGVKGHEMEQFITTVAFFGVACAFFVVSRAETGLQNLFEIPVFMTLMAFLMFGAAPLNSVFNPEALSPNLRGEISLLQPALQIVIVGMLAFWLGALIARPRKPAPAILDLASLPRAAPQMMTLVFGGLLSLAGLGARLYLLRSGMYSFLASFEVTHTRMAEVQFWGVIEGFGMFGLILFAIEAYYHPTDKVRAGLFWGLLVSECLWALISGTKRPLFNTVLAVALVSSFAKRKLRIRWLAPVILGFIAIYPLMINYRTIVRTKVNDSVTSVSAAAAAMRGAVGQAAVREETAGGWAAAGWIHAVSRLDMTQNVALLLAYQDRIYMLEGDCHLWMIPFYPFVPRFIWPGKPVQDFGGRFTRLMGGEYTNASSPTIPGELYALHGGFPGVLAGMFLVGLAMQWLTNPVKLCPSKRNLFIYACMFFAVANWENDFFAYSTGTIRSFVIINIIALIVFGPARTTSRFGAKRQTRM